MVSRKTIVKSVYLLLVLALAGCQAALNPPTLEVTPAATRQNPTATREPATPTTTTSTVPTGLPSATVEPSPTSLASTEGAGQVWIELPRMPFRRSEMPAVVLDDRIYVAGGLGNPGSDRGALVYPEAQSRALEVFDVQTGTWEKLADMPGGRHHLQVTALDGRLYVLGGSGICPAACGFQNTLWVYDPQADTWQELPPMPVDLSAGAAVGLQGQIYLLGGVPGDGQSLLRFDPASSEWENRAHLNQPREHVAAVAYGGQIYVFGGRWKTDLASMENYDPAADTWTAGPDMRTARAGHAAAVVGDLIYVLGGETILSAQETVVETVEIYDPAANRWIGSFDLPTGLHGVGAAGIEGRLYVLGGSTQAGVVANPGFAWVYQP
jgi:hypothetical protein